MLRWLINVLCVILVVKGLEYFDVLSVDYHYISIICGYMYLDLSSDIDKVIKTQQEKLDEIIKAQGELKESQGELKKESWEERRLAVKHLAKFIKYEHKTILEEIRGEYKK